MSEPPLDPIFAVIAENIQAWLAIADACSAHDDAVKQFGKDSPEAMAANVADNLACYASRGSLDKLLKMVPRTQAGMVAYLDHLETDPAFGKDFKVNCVEPEQLIVIMKTIGLYIANRGSK